MGNGQDSPQPFGLLTLCSFQNLTFLAIPAEIVQTQRMKIMCVHAHFDDFEFVAGGTFEMWKRKAGKDLQSRVLICTDGKAGHHFRPREETSLLRIEEQKKSAAIGGYELQILRLPNGQIPREACLQVTTDLLASVWKAIRDFEPDYLICPPVPANPLAGIHVDHVSVAEAVRKVAYMINVPHAFTPEYPADETQSQPCKVPVILNTYDGYMAGNNAYDIAIDVEEAFESIAAMTYCHQSQISEWLPWVGRHKLKKPASLDEWTKTLRARFQRQNKDLQIHSLHAFEVFSVTAWGQVPLLSDLERDWPPLSPKFSRLAELKDRLERWQGV